MSSCGLKAQVRTKIKGDVFQQVSAGKSIEETFQDLKIDVKMRKYYDPQTGELDSSRFPAISLSLENGRQKLAAVRLNDTADEEAHAVALDYINAAKSISDLRLMILSEGKDNFISELMKLQKQDVKSRVELVVDSTLSTPGGRAFRLWTQDESKPLKSAGYATLSSEISVAVEVWKARGRIKVVEFPIHIVGGESLVSDCAILVNRRLIDDFQNRFRLGRSDAVTMLSSIFSKPVLEILNASGDDWSFHVDLDLVAIYDRFQKTETILVRSPVFTLRSLLNNTSTSTPTLPEIEQLKSRLVQVLKDRQLVNFNGFREGLIDAIENTPSALILKDELNSREVRSLLERNGFRTDLIHGFGSLTSGTPFFTGTNSILSGHFALIPDNGVPELDLLITKLYESYGYEPIGMLSSRITTRNLGGIRCASETYRTPIK